LNLEGEHKPIIDVILLPNVRDRSMPYAQNHYPFENKATSEASFPADFISEAMDQTRGWFYTLLVLSTHLFKTAPWKNLIVCGLVLAE